ncbi:MAG: site-specific integrase, partial [Clostridia bacterium]|nr:site-specific integrase [Clostridia bacterium]
MCKICFCDIHRYKSYLKTKEKAAATIEKYIRDATAFSKWLDGKAADKENLLEYKEEISKTLSPGSVNSIISSLNSLLEYLGSPLRLKTLKIQRRIFADKSREL